MRVQYSITTHPKEVSHAPPLQATHQDVCVSTAAWLVPDKEEAVRHEVLRLKALIFYNGYKGRGYPWDFKRSFRSIESRISKAVRERKFDKCYRLDVTIQALELIYREIMTTQRELLR